MIKKILLIEPPITRPSDFGAKKIRIGIVPPLGLAYMAAVLEKNNFDVKICDFLIDGQLEGVSYKEKFLRYGLSDDEIKNEIKIFSPDLVGVSCLFSAKEMDLLNVCRIVKEINQKIITVAGGAHPTMKYNEVLKDINLDFVIMGEGEYSFLNLVNSLNNESDLSQVDGLAYKNRNEILLNPKTNYIENLDELPLPARHLLKMQKYINTSSPHSGVRRHPFTSMITSRGCPYRCTFCVIRNIWGGKARFRSAGNVLMEIEHLIKTYEIKEVHFEDDNITADNQRAKELFSGIINNNWDLNLSSPSGLAVSTLDEDLLLLMKKAGYFSITIAIESGDPDVLKLMRKPVNLERVKVVVDAARKVGLKIKGFFILGYPGETKAQMQKTIDFAISIGLDWSLFFVATSIPGSELESVCNEKGYFVDKNLDYVKQFYVSNIKTPEFEPGYVETMKEKANFEVNFKNNTNLRLKKYDIAIEDFGEVARLYPHLDFAHFYLAIAYQGAGLINDAVCELEKTLELNPQHNEAKEMLYNYLEKSI